MDIPPSSTTARPRPPVRRRALSWRHSRAVLIAAIQASITDRMSLAAAGCAFYATMALFPAISMLISVYGLAFNPTSVTSQLDLLASLLPPPAYTLIEGRVQQLVAQPNGSLSASLLVSFLITFWSASTGAKSVLSALNVAYDVTEQRPFLRFQAIGLAMTLTGVLCAVIAIAVLVFLPLAIDALGLSAYAGSLVHAAGLAMLLGAFVAAISLLYRFGPSRPTPPDPRIGPGAALATVLWLVASELLTVYVSRIVTFSATYGPLGAAVGVMLWFYLSAYAVLLGAELNARLEHEAHHHAPA
ncbi:MAG: YihY/virulence factor BrkB family protein [Acetobacteraceae bacterium]|nr:YihY/virulence factor BrkB family protein [Acetobacteraceae bacterium]